MARLPLPPPANQLARVAADLIVLPAGTELWRIYPRGGAYPTTWQAFRGYGPLAMRFDHHDSPPHEQTRKVYYAAESILTCVAEVFQDTGFIDPTESERWLVGLRLARPVRILSLRGLWPTRAGASMALNTGDRTIARAWSRAIYDAFSDAEGLYYASAMNAHEPAVFLYERAEDTPAPLPFFHRALADPTLRGVLEQAAATLGYGLGQ
ncbi:MAG TPA: RES family NAD+ phosphorylase [Chloroflexota bacterium]|nr:RES family NAD+ phosphorylase [Chloroflexota bacterium]